MIGTFVKGFVTGALAERNKAIILEVGKTVAEVVTTEALGFAKGLIQDYYKDKGKTIHGSDQRTTSLTSQHHTAD